MEVVDQTGKSSSYTKTKLDEVYERHKELLDRLLLPGGVGAGDVDKLQELLDDVARAQMCVSRAYVQRVVTLVELLAFSSRASSLFVAIYRLQSLVTKEATEPAS